ncbi:MAG TPA: carboxyl transferase domain-containing protein [Paracoccaceae bacterium]|nr:carboxyl transferase domain-containing protein [Paracoccaceae bacterium]
MPVHRSRLSPASETFRRNRADMLALVDELRALEARAPAASARRAETFARRGQIPPHDRIARLLDPGMPFLRLHALANYLVEDENPETSLPGASIICGIGFVAGVRCLIWADDSGIRAGAMTRSSLPTVLSIQTVAKRQKLPVIHLVESAGADLMNLRVEGWAEGGALFRNLAQLSAMGIPTVAVLHGPSTAGGAYMPGLSDYVIGVKRNGLAALAGAALVQAATGEVAEDRSLGGAEMHATISGLVEYLAEDDAEALALARDVVRRLDWNKRAAPPPPRPAQPPLHDPEELAGAVPVDYRTPYDAREILCRVVDGSDFEEFKPRYGVTTLCAQASLGGHAVGILANNGPIDPAGATKAAQFLQLMEVSETPVIFLNNTTGYIVGTESEQGGMIKHGSKMIQAVANLTVPKLTLYVGASYGAGNYGMCGYGFEPDFLFAWPNAATNVMGGESAARTMRLVAEAGAKRRGKEIPAEELDRQEARIVEHFTSQEKAFVCSGRLLDHGVIDPRDTRRVLIFALETCLEARHRSLTPTSFGIARM